MLSPSFSSGASISVDVGLVNPVARLVVPLLPTLAHAFFHGREATRF
jgi:hypothetical protein